MKPTTADAQAEALWDALRDSFAMGVEVEAFAISNEIDMPNLDILEQVNIRALAALSVYSDWKKGA